MDRLGGPLTCPLLQMITQRRSMLEHGSRHFTDIGGGYAVISGRQVAFIVDRKDNRAANVIAQVLGRPGRLDEVRSFIELRQNGEAL